MKRFKTALRSRLAIRFVSAMMAVKLNTPEEGEFDPVPFIHSWWNKKVRRSEVMAKEKESQNNTNNFLILKLRVVK